MAASASLDKKTRGSLVVLRLNPTITILGQFGNENGRISYIKTIISGRKFAFISVYAPSQYVPEFFPSLTEVLLHLQDFSLILGADMNCNENLLSAPRPHSYKHQKTFRTFSQYLAYRTFTALSNYIQAIHFLFSKTEFLQNSLYISFSYFLF